LGDRFVAPSTNQIQSCHKSQDRQAMEIEILPMCRFSDAGMTMLSTRCGGRRPKSAKARNRGKWGTGGAAGAMEI
jgi:hypothetical protein